MFLALPKLCCIAMFAASAAPSLWVSVKLTGFHATWAQVAALCRSEAALPAPFNLPTEIAFGVFLLGLAGLLLGTLRRRQAT
mgnify:FL=1